MACSKEIPLLGALALLAGLFLFFGCIQPQQAERCTGFYGDEKDKCLKETAIWYQQPYLCYSVKSLKEREACLEDSTTPQAAQKLKDETLYGKVNKPLADSLKEQSGGSAAKAEVPVSTEEKIVQCAKNEGMTQEACKRMVAIETLNITLCAELVDGNYRSSCIMQVANTNKDPKMCEQLARTDDRNTCKHFSSG